MHADRRTKLHLRAQGIIFHALFAALVVALAYLSTRYVADLDWTAAKRNSISDATVELLGRIEGPIEVTAYATNLPARRELIAALRLLCGGIVLARAVAAAAVVARPPRTPRARARARGPSRHSAPTSRPRDRGGASSRRSRN